MKKNQGQTLAASLVVLAILCILAAVYFVGSGEGGSGRPDGKGQTALGRTIYRAKDEVCKSNLSQVRQALQIAWTTDDQYPGTLEETRLGQSFYECPIGKEAYAYDPGEGKVKCPHPGHEGF